MENYSICSRTFTEHLVNSRKELYDDKVFSDVTLVTDEMVPIQAHKSVLITASSTFKKLLRLNPQSNPILYLRGIQNQDLETILKFIYLGETDVAENRLDKILELANELDLKDFGSNSSINLPSRTEEITNRYEVLKEALDELENNSPTTVQKEFEGSTTSSRSAFKETQKKDNPKKKSSPSNPVVKMENPEENMCKEMMMCKECGKTFSNEYNRKRHVKSVHDEVQYPCQHCDKKFNHQGNVRRHELSVHSSVN